MLIPQAVFAARIEELLRHRPGGFGHAGLARRLGCCKKSGVPTGFGGPDADPT